VELRSEVGHIVTSCKW